MSRHGREPVGERRFPLEPLVKASGARTVSRLIGMLGMESRNFYASTQRATSVSMRLADRYAVQLGLHPSEVWDGWYEACDHADMWRQIKLEISAWKQRQKYWRKASPKAGRPIVDWEWDRVHLRQFRYRRDEKVDWSVIPNDWMAA